MQFVLLIRGKPLGFILLSGQLMDKHIVPVRQLGRRLNDTIYKTSGDAPMSLQRQHIDAMHSTLVE